MRPRVRDRRCTVLTSRRAVRRFQRLHPVGKIPYKQTSVGVKRLGLELDGNAPFGVFDDADIDAAVEGAIFSKSRNMGQTCVSENRLYAQDSIYDQFVEKLAKKVSAMKLGDGAEAGVTQGPLINEKAVEKVERHIADAVNGGAIIVTGGKRHALGGTFFEPTRALERKAGRARLARRNLRSTGPGVPFQGRSRRHQCATPRPLAWHPISIPATSAGSGVSRKHLSPVWWALTLALSRRK
jgi:hypothetical protein